LKGVKDNLQVFGKRRVKSIADFRLGREQLKVEWCSWKGASGIYGQIPIGSTSAPPPIRAIVNNFASGFHVFLCIAYYFLLPQNQFERLS